MDVFFVRAFLVEPFHREGRPGWPAPALAFGPGARPGTRSTHRNKGMDD
jgi:hypothetical protein